MGPERPEAGGEVTARLEVERLSKRFGGTVAVDDLTLSAPESSILALLGPSGCGKTTTLRLVAGFEEPDAGRILAGGQDVTRLPPASRRFGMVFQSYALFPHLDVAGNVAFGLSSARADRAETAAKVERALLAVDLAGFGARRVGELSGGQQQRVALARALAPEPRVLLLDEPLSNLDPSLRERTRFELRQIVRRIGITTVLVTHEQEEAFDLADRIALLRRGRLEQIGSAEELYDSPANAFVAGFVGRASRIAGRVVSASDAAVDVDLGGASWKAVGVLPVGSSVVVTVRPESLRFTSGGDRALSGDVIHRRFLGASALFSVRTAEGTTLEVSAPRDAASIGDRVAVEPIGTRGLHAFPADEA